MKPLLRRSSTEASAQNTAIGVELDTISASRVTVTRLETADAGGVYLNQGSAAVFGNDLHNVITGGSYYYGAVFDIGDGSHYTDNHFIDIDKGTAAVYGFGSNGQLVANDYRFSGLDGEHVWVGGDDGFWDGTVAAFLGEGTSGYLVAEPRLPLANPDPCAQIFDLGDNLVAASSHCERP